MRYVCTECGERYERAGYCARDGKPLGETEDPIVGSEIGRYRIARLLAEGGMGRVYLGVQPAIGSRVAIKILFDSKSPDVLDRFFAEARAVNMIRHENIVSVIDMAKLDDGRPYIVMEYIEGHTLASIVRGGGAPLGGVVQVMLEVLGALAAAHAIGIVHRDLKPDNVLVTGEGHAKVLDFGIAKLLPGLSQQLSPRTRTGALLGTPAYMAPEQISGSGHIDPRTDIYAAGIVFYEAVTGRVPFVGETLFDLMRMHLETPPPPPRTLRPDLPVALEQAILQALAKDPAQRFQTVAAMAHAVKHGSSELKPEDWQSLSKRGAIITTSPPSTTATQTVREPEVTRVDRKSHAPWIVGLIATAAIAVLVTLLVVRRDPPAAPAASPGSGLVAVDDVVDDAVGDAAGAGEVAAEDGVEVAADDAVADAGAPAGPTPAGPTPTASTPAGPSPVESRDPSPSAKHRADGPARTATDATDAKTQAPGRGVTIVVTPPQKEISIAADYDPKRFEPLSYLPKATALARKLYPDARLTRFDFVPVRSNGRADLTMRDAEGSYWFRSSEHSKRSVDVPPNMPQERPCMIYVDVYAKQVTARIVTNDDCDDRLVRTPKCKLDAVWKQALAAGVPSNHVAKISWLFDEKWFFDTDLAGEGNGETTSFADRCP